MSETFRALLLEQVDGRTEPRLTELDLDRLPPGEVLLWQGSPKEAMRLLPTQVWTLRGLSAANEASVRAEVEAAGVQVAGTAPDPEAWLGFLLRSGGG